MYNIIIESGVPMKLHKLIKICLNETYSKAHIGKWSKTGRCFNTTAFQLCFRIYNEDGLRKPGWTEIEWNMSASGLCS
jgi:hypothetical protein